MNRTEAISGVCREEKGIYQPMQKWQTVEEEARGSRSRLVSALPEQLSSSQSGREVSGSYFLDRDYDPS